LRLVLDSLDSRRYSASPLQLDSLGLGSLCGNPNDDKQARLLSLVTVGDKDVCVDPSWKETDALKVSWRT
jgi:hypothetical protein